LAGKRYYYDMTKTTALRSFSAVVGLLTLAGCGGASKPTAADASKFLADAETKVDELGVEAGRAAWVQSNFITDDTEAIAAKAAQRAIDYGAQLAKEAAKYDGVDLPADQRRKMNLLKIGLTLATPADPKESEEATKLAAGLEAAYGKGKYCEP